MQRQTRQLRALCTVLQAATRPLTLAELRGAAAEEVPRLGQATAYRIIGGLCAEGQAVAVRYPGQPVRYEWARGEHHAHLICHGCGRVFDVGPSPAVRPPARLPRGFQVSGEEVVYYGRCADCRRGPGAGPAPRPRSRVTRGRPAPVGGRAS